jgi:hypothetical protein
MSKRSIWLIGFAGLMMLIVVIPLWYFNHPDVPIMRPLVLVWDRGLYITYDGSKVTYLTSPRDKKGEGVWFPEFVEWQDKLVYWADTDKALAIVQSNGKTRWLDVSKHLPPATERVRLVIRGDEVLLNLYSRTLVCRYLGVLKVNLLTGTVSVVPHVLEARASSGEGYLALLGENGVAKVHTASGTRIYDCNVEFIDWDYDAQNDYFVVLTEDGVEILSSRSASSVSPPWPYFGRRVYARPDAGGFWLLCHKPFHFGTVVLAYDYNGKLKGKVLEIGYEFLGVIEASDRAIATLTGMKKAWSSSP